jgi:glycosyltransferase involved in cell wall biosynthesis
MKNIEYSVVIPFGKKNGDFIRCIQSIARQAYRPKIIIVVCNNQITSSFIKESNFIFSHDAHSLIEYIYPDVCQNANVARNIGLSFVRTNWVAFMDSDDWWEDGWAHTVRQKVQADNEIEFIYGSISIFKKNGYNVILKGCHYSDYVTAENYLLAYMPAQTSSFFISTNLAKKILWDESISRHQDYDFFVRITSAAKSTSYINDALVNIDWAEARRHKFHQDCLRVVDKWSGKVERKYYLRHLTKLLINAIISKDWKAILPLVGAIANAIYFNNHLKINSI